MLSTSTPVPPWWSRKSWTAGTSSEEFAAFTVPIRRVARDQRLVARGLAEPVDGVEHLGHVGQQVLALAADPGPRAAPVQQRDAELALQLAERLAQGRLGQVQRLAGAAQRAVLGDGGEVLQLFDAHAGSVRRGRCKVLPITPSTVPPTG